jgi:hypothetical protein
MAAGQEMQASQSDGDESAFRQWYSGWSQKAGIAPDPDDPLHKYDYRAAHRAGVEPTLNPRDGRYHWPSKTPDGKWLKSQDHPTAWKETYMERHGVDPDDVGAQGIDDAPRGGSDTSLVHTNPGGLPVDVPSGAGIPVVEDDDIGSQYMSRRQLATSRLYAAELEEARAAASEQALPAAPEQAPSSPTPMPDEATVQQQIHPSVSRSIYEAVKGDLGKMAGELFVPVLLGGARDAVNEAVRFTNDLVDFARAHDPATLLGLPMKNLASPYSMVTGRTPKGEAKIPDPPQVQTPESLSGQIVRGGVAFLAPYLGVMKAVKAAQVPAKLAPFVGSAAATFAFTNPRDPGVTDLIRQHLPGPVGDAIQMALGSSEDESVWSARLKKAVEDMYIGKGVQMAGKGAQMVGAGAKHAAAITSELAVKTVRALKSGDLAKRTLDGLEKVGAASEHARKPVAPVTFLGMQQRAGGKPPLELYNLTQGIEGHPVGSTLTRETLEAKGFRVPSRAMQEAKGERGAVGKPPAIRKVGDKFSVGPEMFDTENEAKAYIRGIQATIRLFRGGKEDGHFWSESSDTAKAYAGAAGSPVSEQVMTFKNLLRAENWMDAKDKMGLPRSATMPELVEAIQKSDYDAVAYKGSHGVEYIVNKNPHSGDTVKRMAPEDRLAAAEAELEAASKKLAEWSPDVLRWDSAPDDLRKPYQKALLRIRQAERDLRGDGKLAPPEDGKVSDAGRSYGPQARGKK